MNDKDVVFSRQSDLAVGFYPLPTPVRFDPNSLLTRGTSERSLRITPAYLSSLLNSLPCSLVMHRDSSPYVLSEVVREARNLVANMNQVE